MAAAAVGVKVMGGVAGMDAALHDAAGATAGDRPVRPSVLVFAGLDPSGGAGLAADITAISALGAHALPVITVLTAQDNDRVHKVEAVDAQWLRRQAGVLIAKMPVAAIKIGIIGSLANAMALVELITQLRQTQPDLPVVLDPVLASGHGDALAQEDPLSIIAPLLRLASVILPNRLEAARLAAHLQAMGIKPAGGIAPADGGAENPLREQAARLLNAGCGAVMLKGGHADGAQVENICFTAKGEQRWQWPRMAGAFHGSGCTLASSLAAALALNLPDPYTQAQTYTQAALANAYSAAPGQSMPARVARWEQEKR